MEPVVWGAECAFGLPTVDPAALRLHANFRFISASDTEIDQTRNSLVSFSTNFPTFRHRNCEFKKLRDVEEYLTKKDVDIDAHLSHSERCEMYIFKQYAESVLNPSLSYSWWVDEKNYQESIRPWFAKNIAIPLNFYYPSQNRKKAEELIDILYGESYEKNHLYHKIYKAADNCFEKLSIKLANNPFFHGRKPCSLDATVFSYLAPILKVPLVDPNITNFLKKYDNLVNYVNRITGIYFEKSERAYVELKKKQSTKIAENGKNESEYLHHSILAILFATLAMLGFAHSNGLIAKAWSDANMDYNDMFDNEDDDS